MIAGNIRFRVAAAMLVSGLATWSAPTRAGVAEPNGLSIPQPISADAPHQTAPGSQGSLCASNEVCDRGSCVKSCGSGEFPCNAGFVCSSGYCVETSCATVTCAEGKVCHNGVCAGPCDGVTCPQAQVCNAGVGKCVDACAGVTCGANRVCDGGVCVSACTCKGCEAGHVCNQGSGHCVDPGCENTMWQVA